MSNAAKKSGEMKAEKRLFNLLTRKGKLTLPEQLQGSRAASQAAGDQKEVGKRKKCQQSP